MVLSDPLNQGHQGIRQLLTLIRYRVLHPGRDLIISCSLQDTISLQLFQPSGEGLGANMVHKIVNFVESQSLLGAAEYEEYPNGSSAP